MVILQMGNSISSIRDSGHGMKELGAFITQFNSVCCEPLFPIEVFVS